jgi:hypothetical protein
MKSCPRCNKAYSDDTLNFCLDDGELLTMQQPSPGGYMEPPTMVLDGARVTDPISNWQQPTGQPPAQWNAPGPMAQQPFASYPMTVAPNQTLALVSTCLGAASVTIGWCCYIGVLLAPAAIITGIIAKSNIKKDPQRYSGNGLALAGIIMGSLYFVGLILIIVIYGLAAIGGAFSGR